MPEEDIPSMLRMIEEKIASSGIKVEYRGVLVRLRSMLEEDLQAAYDQPLSPPVDQMPGSTAPKVSSGLPHSPLDN